jgi:8-oxo-dGTP diphosphatase
MANTNDEPIKNAVAVIVYGLNRNGKHMLLSKRKGSTFANMWQTPGGWLNPGEAPRDGAMREVKEETDVVLDYMFDLAEVTGETPNGGPKYIVTFYWAILSNEQIMEVKLMEPDKCYGWEWHPLDNLPTPLIPTLAEVIKFTWFPVMKLAV